MCVNKLKEMIEDMSLPYVGTQKLMMIRVGCVEGELEQAASTLKPVI